MMKTKIGALSKIGMRDKGDAKAAWHAESRSARPKTSSDQIAKGRLAKRSRKTTTARRRAQNIKIGQIMLEQNFPKTM
jgi:hypothetical protein